LRVTFLVLVTIVAITAWHFGPDISLHHVIVRCSRNRKLIWTVINRRQHAGEIVVWRRRRSGPLESCCLPRIVRCFLAFEAAPEDVEVEEQLRRDRDHRRY